MANTKTTTPTSLARQGAMGLGGVLALFAAINLFSTMTPVARSSALIDARFEKAQALPQDQKIEAYKKIRDDQIKILAQKPSDPYGWARLSYMRLMTTRDQKAALADLAMSDFVSPYEAPQLPERAVMWYRYRDVESKEQQDYQDILWRKSYILERTLTRKTAVQNNLVPQLGETLKKMDPMLYGDWKDHLYELK